MTLRARWRPSLGGSGCTEESMEEPETPSSSHTGLQRNAHLYRGEDLALRGKCGVQSCGARGVTGDTRHVARWDGVPSSELDQEHFGTHVVFCLLNPNLEA